MQTLFKLSSLLCSITIYLLIHYAHRSSAFKIILPHIRSWCIWPKHLKRDFAFSSSRPNSLFDFFIFDRLHLFIKNHFNYNNSF